MIYIKNLEKPYYGYRINAYLAAALIGSGIVFVILAIIFTILMYLTLVLILCWALATILISWGTFWQLFIGWVSNSEKVDAFQHNLINQLIMIWNGKGKVLDIGTGLGRSAIEIAKIFPESQVIGVDTWTKKWSLWGMTKEGAEKNAKIENVNSRCTFQYGNALNLPFEEGEFKLVVSTFAFHEIHVPDRIVLFKEIVRVLDFGGCFIICDNFPRGYKVNNIQELLEKIELLGFKDIKHKYFKEAGVNFLGLYNILGLAYLYGRKV